ncbi:MAG: NADH-quinone oxidoreductase subunit C [Treponema sp.]|nr:NADH-quinone oxidoreductase subunit C [Treponema sp.]
MDQQILDVENVDLLNKVMHMKNTGYRLAQICAVKTDKLTLLYTFIKSSEMITFRLGVNSGEPVESISRIYSYSYLYENEMKDLFGVNMVHMRIDYNGHFYETSVKTPFNQEIAPVNPEKTQLNPEAAANG